MIKKNLFKILSSLILVGGLAKVLSIIAKIVIARKISTYAMSIYSLTIPTLSLLLNFAQFGIPTTISKLIAKKKFSVFKIMQVSVILLLVLDLIVGVVYIFLVPTIAENYLKNPLTYPTLYGMVLLLPLISMTSLLKGYFIGIDKVEKTNVCQISEELARLLFIITLVDFIDKNNTSLLSFFAMFSTIIGEIASLIHLLISLKLSNKQLKKRIKKHNEENKKISKLILKLSAMNTSTKMIGSFIYFLEPIIFTMLMLKSGVNQELLTLEYGIINSYVFPLLLLPTFFSNCISIYMLPKLSSLIENKEYTKSRKTFLSISLICFLSGFICLLVIYLYPSFFTKLLYGKEIGINYIKKYSLLISGIFLQMPIHIAMISFDKEKFLLIESIVCNIIRIIGFFIFIPIYHTDGMIVSILITIYLSLFMHIVTLFKSFIILKKKSKTIVNI